MVLRLVVDRGALGNILALTFNGTAARRHVRQLITGLRFSSWSTHACRLGRSLDKPTENGEAKNVGGEQDVLPGHREAPTHQVNDENEDDHDRDRDHEIEPAADRSAGARRQVAPQQVAQKHNGKTGE